MSTLQSQFGLDTLSAFSVVLLLAAAVPASIAIAMRRAARDAETRLLRVVCALAAAHLACYAAGADDAGDMLGGALLALGMNFLGLTYLRVSRDRVSDPPMFLGMNQRRVNFVTMTGVFYAFAAVLVGWRALALAHWVRPPSDSATGFASGLFIGLCPGLQFIILGEVYRVLPEEKKTRGVARLLRPLFDGEHGQVNWEELSINPSTPRPAATQVDLSAELKAFFGLICGYVLVIALVFMRDRAQTEWWWILADHLKALLFLLPLVYYKTQFVFFDVLIKRGAVAAALVASSAVYFGLAARLARLGVTAALALWIAAAVFTALWMPAWRGLSRAIDRHVFHRPDYPSLLQRISDEMAEFGDGSALVNHVASVLKAALGAEFVGFRKNGEPAPSATAATIAAGNRGSFDFGARDKGQPYRSEDLGFLSAIARQTGAALDSMERREMAARAELRALRAQINPHFLFNALNTLADMTHSDPKSAEILIVDLAGVFRYALDATRREEVPVGEELDFLRSYLEIEQARFGARLRFQIEASEYAREAAVPAMLIQPLVENAVKHGIAPREKGGSIEIRAMRHDETLQVWVRDDGPGFDPARGRSGVGLANVRGRVEKIGGVMTVETAGGACIRLELPVRRTVACVS